MPHSSPQLWVLLFVTFWLLYGAITLHSYWVLRTSYKFWVPGLDKGSDNMPYLDMVGNVSGSLSKMTLAELQTYSTVGVYMELDAHLRSEDTHLLAARKLMVEDKELAAKAKKRRKKAEEPRDEEIARHFTEAAGYRGLVDQNKKFIHFVISQCAWEDWGKFHKVVTHDPQWNEYYCTEQFMSKDRCDAIMAVERATDDYTYW